MRIIGGKYKGRRFSAPRGFESRPTTDFAKEALFNILTNRYDLEEVRVLDLFAGTGNLTYEFISRGAIWVTAVDKDPKSVKFIDQNLKGLGEEKYECVKADVLQYLQRPKGSYDIIVADPPYDLPQLTDLPSLVFENGFLKSGGCLVLEHGKRTPVSHLPNFSESRNYGNVNFSIFTKA